MIKKKKNRGHKNHSLAIKTKNSRTHYKAFPSNANNARGRARVGAIDGAVVEPVAKNMRQRQHLLRRRMGVGGRDGELIWYSSSCWWSLVAVLRWQLLRDSVKKSCCKDCSHLPLIGLFIYFNISFLFLIFFKFQNLFFFKSAKTMSFWLN